MTKKILLVFYSLQYLSFYWGLRVEIRRKKPLQKILPTYQQLRKMKEEAKEEANGKRPYEHRVPATRRQQQRQQQRQRQPQQQRQQQPNGEWPGEARLKRSRSVGGRGKGGRDSGITDCPLIIPPS